MKEMRADQSHSSIPILLVGGTGRCGTTVLNRVLERHPDTVVTPPWRFMVDPDGVFDFLAGAQHAWSPYHADIRLKRLRRLLADVARPSLPHAILERRGLRQWLRGWGIGLLPRYAHLNAAEFCPGFEGLVERFLGRLTSFEYPADWVGTRFLERHRMAYSPPDDGQITQICAEFFHGVVEATCRTHDARVFVDRNTWNPLWLDRFLAIAPQTKLLHIYRDPRDVVASFTNQPWVPKDPVQAAVTYRDLMGSWWRVRERVPASSYFELSLEALAAQPEPMLRRICDFAGLPWDDRLLEVRLDAVHAGRWKRDIAEGAQPAVLEILAPAIEALGYDHAGTASPQGA